MLKPTWKLVPISFIVGLAAAVAVGSRLHATVVCENGACHQLVEPLWHWLAVFLIAVAPPVGAMVALGLAARSRPPIPPSPRPPAGSAESSQDLAGGAR